MFYRLRIKVWLIGEHLVLLSMICKELRFIASFGMIIFLSLVLWNLPNVFAEENTGYQMAENVKADFTFIFRDGIEHHQFPVFKMTSNLVDNRETTFQVEGIIGKAPHLHQALDDAFKYRVVTSTGASSFEYDYRFFDVDIDISRNNEPIRVLHYYNCEVLDYEAVSLNSNDYESYFSSNSGFAVVDKIEFRCGGLSSESIKLISSIETESPYQFAEGVRTFVTFGFNDGVETIGFPSFELTSGFEESNDSVAASFRVEGILENYPLLNKEIEKSRKVSGLGVMSNTDFDALVEFSKEEKILRGLDFRDCRVAGAIITTESDKEEGYTGKSGFALVHVIDFECSGLKPMNQRYGDFDDSFPEWRSAILKNDQMNEGLLMANETRIISTFTYNNGVETIEFPIFRQGNVLQKSNPTFELEGIVGDYPILYNAVDKNLKLQSMSGANNMSDLFDVDVNVVTPNEIIRGFNYSNCRIIDYVIASDRNAEETYIKKIFALENTFEFECQGYHPNNPGFDATLKPSKANTQSSLDLKKTDDWPAGFFVERDHLDKKQKMLMQEQKARLLLEKANVQARY